MNRTRQKGAVLIVSLIILLIMTFIGLAGMEMTGMEEKMAGNMRDRNMAFQAAEATLLEGEQFVETQSPMPLFDGNNGLYPLLSNGKKRWDEVDWSANSDIRSYAGQGLGELSAAPAYIVEELHSASSDDNLDPGEVVEDDRFYYRVTARAAGQTNAAEVMLQTIYRK